MTRPRALVLDSGRTRGALAAVRALARAGWDVGVASASPAPSLLSRHTSFRHPIAQPVLDPDRFVKCVRTAVAARGYEVVLPSADAEMVTLSERRGEVDSVVPYPPHETVMRALDKLELHRAAQAVGLPSPPTEESSARGPAKWETPLIVKPRLHSTSDSDPERSRLKTHRAQDESDVSSATAEIRSADGVPVLQELTEGRLMAVAVVADRGGRLVTAVQQVASEVFPPRVGISARAETVALDPELESGIARLLGELEWFGIAQLQFMNPEQPKLIDFNGRLFGSLALPVAAGANLPAIWAALATGRELPADRQAQVGRRYQWLEGDVRRALRVRDGGLVADLAATARYSIGSTGSVWQLKDPAPALSILADAPLRASRRAAARLHRRTPR